MPFGQLDERRSRRFGVLLNTMLGNELRNQKAEQDVERNQAQSEEARRILDAYRVANAPRTQSYEQPIDMPQSPSRSSMTGRPEFNIPTITPTETRQRTVLPTPEEQDQAYNETYLRLLSRRNNPSALGAAKEMSGLRRTIPKQDLSRTPFEVYSQGGTRERQTVQDYLRLTDKPNLRENLKVGVNPSTGKHEYFSDTFNPRTGQTERDWTGYEAPKPSGGGGGGAGLSDSERIQVKKEITRLTEKAVNAGNAMKTISEGKQYTYIDEDGAKHVINPGTPEADVFKENMQNVIDATNQSLEEMNKEIGGTYRASQEPAKAMTKSQFLKDFKNDTGRDPNDKEIEVAKRKGLWE